MDTQVCSETIFRIASMGAKAIFGFGAFPHQPFTSLLTSSGFNKVSDKPSIPTFARMGQYNLSEFSEIFCGHYETTEYGSVELK